ncbi:DUF1499 domain-containing protein [Mesorhizobium sp.]|uniref:DUF1499 domain-containing protein n=1 Tax=Mesorhizobium sp. TaxID=1871066 RepID=UPI000FE37475|nr:DUF1499 domain-containing protein [Mesorhizobium sp.]RWN55612.1 MAG: DUF1499 domain-containing protein [Mesorhizobium sp.]RWN77237.1 MAG: DUF1499 domain-containing protein [Mesorhizobium sp.]RWN80224.1 MAG: DUF1499 domain-containing protein [Mesorhizobium sp.]RWN86137.1 MAG: DUF1499 domain-containing protein [Mesorhizobium sp.]RWO14973.1 MAG: DUF1499 domain-containing protein [Mesorhizobium sp.]
MMKTPERQTSRAAGWSRRTGAFSAVLLLTVLVGHRYRLVETPAFLWVLGIVALLAAFALLFAGFAFSRLWNFGDRGGRDLTVGTVLALLVLVPFGIAAYWAATSPPLRDISTDFDDPPVLDTSTRTGDMNALSPPTPGERRLQTETYPLVTGRSYNLPFDRVLEAVATVLGRRDWQLAAQFPRAIGQSEVTINALARSFILSLPADVAIRVTDDGDAVLVDMRSASRYGRYDLGDNAARIVDFLAELDQEVAGQVGTAPAE